MTEREPKNRPDIPDWALIERLGDQLLIQDNFYILWPAAQTAFKDLGRGVIVIDTTSQPISGEGHPFGYFSREQLEEHDDEDTKRMIREYNPRKEFVVMLIKADDRTSTYRIRPQPRKRS